MITLGIVGCAHVHAPWIVGTLKARTDARVKSIYDHDTGRAERQAQVVSARVASSAEEIFSDPGIDAIFIMSETNQHECDVLAAAEAGKPVFVEKPLAMGARDGFLMAEALERSGKFFMTGYRTRSEGLFKFLKNEIAKGHFGRITRIRYNVAHGALLSGGFDGDHAWMNDTSQAFGGVFVDLGTHALDSVCWLMGEPVLAATAAVGVATKSKSDPLSEDYGEGLLRFESGALGSIGSGAVDVAEPVRCVISGTEGHAHVVRNQLYYQSKHVKSADGKSVWNDLPLDDPLVFDHFIDALQGNTRMDFITPREAATDCAVMEAMIIGGRTGTWIKPARG